MGRIPKLTPAFVQSFGRSPARREVLATVRRLARASALPLAGDRETYLSKSEMAFIEGLEGRRVVSAYARRIKGHRLWLYYRLPTERVVELLLVSMAQPS